MSTQVRNRKGLMIGAALAALAVAGLGGLATDIGPWYYQLAKPAWQPPDWLFGPVWTLIFALAAAAGFSALDRTAPGDPDAARILALFTVNGLLNILWSVLFFRLRRPDWALPEVLLLWLSIVALIFYTGRLSRVAGALLVPYLAWVSFASVLNYAIVVRNAPFGP